MQDETRGGARGQAEVVVRLAYETVDQLVERHAANVSRGGIFVRAHAPLPLGTHVSFEVKLADGGRAISGTGVVTWVAPPGRAGEAAAMPGMGIQFATLDAESRGVVDLIVATRGGDGSTDEPPRPGAGTVYEEISPPAVVSTAPSGIAPPAAAPRTRRPVGKPSQRVVGIDLGTTNSCIAVAEGNGARVIASKLGYTTIPSVVSYDDDGGVVVGRPARQRMLLRPRNTVYGSKRLVGRPFASPTVQACRDRFHYEIVEGEAGEAAVRVAGRVLSLEQVAAALLGELREVASESLGEEVTRAAITVPAYYNDHQRQAVRAAGALAGLRVERIVNEPTAASVAFGFGRGLRKRVLVYDLGGGTFDASVVEVDGDVYEVVSTGGDTFLGGVDFDNQLVDHLVHGFMQQNGFAPPDDVAVWQRIVEAAEQTKVALSAREAVVAHVPLLCKAPGSGRDVDLQATVTRAELEHLTGRLVDRTIEVCEDVLRARGLGKEDLDEVLLVGGQSRMPLVWRRIGEALGKDPSKSVHPDEAVAVGAALLADSDARIDSVVLLDALAMSIGVGLPGGRMVPVLSRNTRLPARRSYEVTIPADRRQVELTVFQGDSPHASECEYLGTLRIGAAPGAPEGGRVAVEFALGNEGILSLRARDVASGRVTALELATIDTPATLREKLQLPAPPVAPRGARPIEGSPRRVDGGAAPAIVGGALEAPQPGAEVPPRAPAATAGPEGAPRAARKGFLSRLLGRS
jgi:molecular chaperone DnaK